MKFTKEEAIERIKAIFADKAKGIDLDRTITDAVSNGMEMVGENSEMELDAFAGFVEKNVSSALGLARHERSTFSTNLQEQIAELQRKLEGKPPTNADDKNPPKSDDPAIQALMDEVRQMKAKLTAREAEATIAEKRNQLIAKMGESIKDKDWIEAYIAEISITADFDVEAKAKDYVAFYNKTQTRGGKITPKPTDNPEDSNTEVKKVIEDAKAIMAQRQGVMGTTVTSQTNV